MTELTEEEAREQIEFLSWRRTGMLMAALALTCFGLVMVYSASAVRAARGGGWEMSYAWNQLSWFAVALVAMFVTRTIPYRFWARIWPLTFVACQVLLLLVMSPLGTRVNGANRWFRIAGISIQPSELAKFAMLTVVAALLARVLDGKPRFFRHFLPLVAVVGVTVCLVAAEPDFGTAALIGAALTVLMLAGGVRIWQLLLLLAPAVPVAAWYGYTKFDYINHRIESWLAGEAFHTNVSKLAIGSGGVWGVGLGQGPAKLDYLPEAHTDFIFAMIGQETGLIGALSLLAIFCILVWQGIAIARNAPDRFGSLLAFGITVVIGGQTLFNMGVVTGMLPPKGISLPFVSFGGSGLVVFYSMIGVMCSITRGVKIPEVKKTNPLDRYRPIPEFNAALDGIS
jgi:Bacterial cell division membrane protein